VSKWYHNVTWKSGCFSAPERGGFLKISGILQLIKMGPFWGSFVRSSILSHRLVGLGRNFSKEESENLYPAG